MENLDRIETFMQSHSIPNDLRSRVRMYYHYLWKNHKGYQDHTLLEDLPTKMQSDLFMHINRSVVEKVPLFRGASQDFIEDLMNKLEPRILVPGERVFRIDERGDSMYFIHHGEIDIIGRDSSVIATLKDGSFFGEFALLSDGNRSATAKANAYSHVYVLSKDSFNHVVDIYPSFRDHINDVVNSRKVS